jgi:uncharacterized tellurite resistance protein B-like protein
MADDLREFIDEHFRRFDEKLDRLISVLVELHTTQAGRLQSLAAMDNRDLSIEQRLECIEARLGLIYSRAAGIGDRQ